MCMKNGFPRHECQGQGLPTNLGHATCHTTRGSFTNGWTRLFNTAEEDQQPANYPSCPKKTLKFPTPLLSYFSTSTLTWRFQRLAAGNCRRKQSWIHAITWFNLTSELYFHRVFFCNRWKQIPTRCWWWSWLPFLVQKKTSLWIEFWTVNKTRFGNFRPSGDPDKRWDDLTLDSGVEIARIPPETV